MCKYAWLLQVCLKRLLQLHWVYLLPYRLLLHITGIQHEPMHY